LTLRDYKVTSGFSRTIRTRGDVHLTGKGDLGSSSVVCRSALSRADCVATCIATTPPRSTSQQNSCRISARRRHRRAQIGYSLLSAGSRGSIEIKGRMSGEIVAHRDDSKKRRAREGDVTARAIRLKKADVSGQLVIWQGSILRREELLEEQKPDVAHVPESDFSGVDPRPLPCA